MRKSNLPPHKNVSFSNIPGIIKQRKKIINITIFFHTRKDAHFTILIAKDNNNTKLIEGNK
ncbi:MAG TPA: hypothetical protein DCS13_09815 [Candidatus Margulisbacteria bacterium]|nr:MAG: hypothetical protein A2X43_08080 [Candidatus Margulisbacteria bacterium GWD2_39_127]HAR63748.1 hypothetical protein [Candidatus Margulisiibacteriota bacterium]